jgi:hypothetical protein
MSQTEYNAFSPLEWRAIRAACAFFILASPKTDEFHKTLLEGAVITKLDAHGYGPKVRPEPKEAQ